MQSLPFSKRNAIIKTSNYELWVFIKYSEMNLHDSRLVTELYHF